MSKQTFRRTFTPGGIIISGARVAAKSNGALGIPGSGRAPLSCIEMEGMGGLRAAFIETFKKEKKKNTATGFAVGL